MQVDVLGRNSKSHPTCSEPEKRQVRSTVQTEGRNGADDEAGKEDAPDQIEGSTESRNWAIIGNTAAGDLPCY